LGSRRTSIKSDESDLYPVDRVRRALTWIETPQSNETFFLEQLAALFRPNPIWLAAFSQLIDDDPYPLGNYLISLATAAGTPWSSQLTGDNPSQLENYLISLATATGAPWEASGRSPGDLGRPETGALRTHEVLGEWAARFARVWKDRVQLQRDRLRDHPELIYVLRGDNPEMRPAIRLALAEAVPEDNGLAVLARIAQQILPIPTTDLYPDAVPRRNSPDARRTLVQLVEYVDRSGVMREFLAVLLTERPNSQLLHRVGAAFAIWDDAHARMLSALTARLHG
jgi:hypothetical protein